jgi:putative DNA primase/helicase
MAEEGGKIVRLVIDGAREVRREDLGGGGGGGPGGGGVASHPVAVFASDDYLGLAASHRLGDDWRSLPGNRWRHWDGMRWADDATGEGVKIAREVCRDVSDQIDNAKLSRQVSSKSTVNAALWMAHIDRRQMTEESAFDQGDWLLNTPAGIVDLLTGQIGPHDKSKLLTRLAGASAGGEAPHFARYLAEATGGDLELQRYLQRIAGYCLTGSTREHAIFFLYGPGGTGKSRFLDAMRIVLGDYAATAPMDTFTVATGERHSAGLAMLSSARLVTASETEEGRRWDEALLCAITGGEQITARKMRQDFFSFVPRFKLLFSGNHRPRMRSAGSAMRRRFALIPFTHKPQSVDEMLPEKLLAERDGILKWAVAGVIEWQRNGLKPPRVVVAATDKYFEQENVVGRWIEERCVVGDNLRAASSEMYRDYASWAKLAGEFVGSERTLSQKLEERFEQDRWRPVLGDRAKVRGFKGLQLRLRADQLPLGGAYPPSRAVVGEPAYDKAFDPAAYEPEDRS